MDLEEAPGFSLAVMITWRVEQQMEDLSVLLQISLCVSVFKKIQESGRFVLGHSRDPTGLLQAAPDLGATTASPKGRPYH